MASLVVLDVVKIFLNLAINSIAALAGQVFGMRFQIQSKRNLTFASSSPEPNTTADAAAVTKATVSTMVPNQQVFVIATTVWP
jgi:hypothetical protein